MDKGIKNTISYMKVTIWKIWLNAYEIFTNNH